MLPLNDQEAAQGTIEVERHDPMPTTFLINRCQEKSSILYPVGSASWYFSLASDEQ
jgi:hypothetical protein